MSLTLDKMAALSGIKNSDATTLLRASRELRMRSPSTARTVNETALPAILDSWGDNPIARLAFSILERSPLLVADALHRSQLDPMSLVSVLHQAQDGPIGNLLLVHDIHGGRHALATAYDAEGQLRFPVVALSTRQEDRGRIASYLLSSLAAANRAIIDTVE